MGASHLGRALESACAVAAAVCMAVGLAPSASADDTMADATQLPDHIVNGDFEYQHDWFREHAAYGWTAVIPSTGLNWNARTKSYQPGPDDWNEARFGWHSTQVDGTNGEPDGTGDSYKPGDMIAIDRPTTLYAQWADTTQTAMPETGGTLTNRNLTTILGGGCLFGLILIPFARRRMRRSR